LAIDSLVGLLLISAKRVVGVNRWRLADKRQNPTVATAAWQEPCITAVAHGWRTWHSKRLEYYVFCG